MQVSARLLIPLPVDRVWACAAQDNLLARWVPQAQEARVEPPGPAQVGQRLSLELQLPRSRAQVVREVVQCEPPHLLRWRTVREVIGGRELSPTRRVDRTLQLVEAPGGTLAHMSIAWNPQGPLDWLFSLLLARRILRQECRQSLEGIARLAQERQPQGQPGERSQRTGGRRKRRRGGRA